MPYETCEAGWCGRNVHHSTVIHFIVNRTCENEQLQEATRRRIASTTARNTGDHYNAYLGHARDHAKLGGVVLFVDTHPNTNIQSVNCTCEN